MWYLSPFSLLSELANRLTANPKINVLLIEAGPEDKKTEIHIPLAASKLQRTELDWCYKTIPQKSTCDRVHNWPRGKVLGGCSSTNWMLYVRGNKSDYDSWEKDHGCVGWNYENVLPYFVKSETSKDIKDENFRGKNGPLVVQSFENRHSTMGAKILEATKSAGFEQNPDYNGKDQFGFSSSQVTINEGKRSSTATSYLKEAKNRTNLKV